MTHLIESLDDPPHWLSDLAHHIAAPQCAARACVLITKLGRLLTDGGSTHPQALIERARIPGRSMGTLAKVLQDFFTSRGMAVAVDHDARLSIARRQRRITAVPAPFRPAAAAFADHLLRQQARARRAGTRPRADSTIDGHLDKVRDFAVQLTVDGRKTDWATVDVHDVEAFLAAKPGMRKSRLAALRQFFSFARRQRLILIDPTNGLTAFEPRGFRGKTVGLSRQRQLYRRWSSDLSVHPHEAFVGLLALLHGASCLETRTLTIEHIDHAGHSVQLGQRPLPTSLDPATWAALGRCLAHRGDLATANPHVIVTKGTKTTATPASPAYLSHVLDAVDVAPKFLRSTRLLELASGMDPKLVAAIMGIDAEGVLPYLADRIDPTRLSNLSNIGVT